MSDVDDLARSLVVAREPRLEEEEERSVLDTRPQSILNFDWKLELKLCLCICVRYNVYFLLGNRRILIREMIHDRTKLSRIPLKQNAIDFPDILSRNQSNHDLESLFPDIF